MALNTLGAQVIYDFGVPKIISAVAVETISGGYLVGAQSGTTSLSSGANSFTPSMIMVAGSGNAASGNLCIGMALNTVTSGQTVSVLTEGVVVLPAGAAITAPTNIAPDLDHAVVLASANYGNIIGKALNCAASGAFAPVLLRI